MNFGDLKGFLYIFHTKDLNPKAMEDAGEKVAVIGLGAIEFEVVDILKSKDSDIQASVIEITNIIGASEIARAEW